jgi:hypothetical protein
MSLQMEKAGFYPAFSYYQIPNLLKINGKLLMQQKLQYSSD